MISRGTLDREDDGPTGTPGHRSAARVRQTVLLRPEQRLDEEDQESGHGTDDPEAMSQGSEVMNESVVSSVTDR